MITQKMKTALKALMELAAERASEDKLRKQLNLARDAERAIDGVPGRNVANWVEGKV
ncbi:MAG: hypothetical protein Q7J57_17995 [Gemmobacter sp.]|nr:hypothetical protein [Gemmobacter sp.]